MPAFIPDLPVMLAFAVATFMLDDHTGSGHGAAD